MNINNFKTRKGSIATDNMGNLILLAIILGVGIYFIWAYVLHGGGDSIKELQKCGALTGNAGVCRETCDSVSEYDAGSVGCSGVQNKCCVLIDEDYDVLTPAPYGGDSTLDLKVIGIKFGTLPQGCNQNNNDLTRINCVPNMDYNVPVIVTVESIGISSPNIFAVPLVMINGDTKINNWPDRFKTRSQGNQDIVVNIRISTSESIKDRFWEIYGYAQCTSDDCRKTDGQSRGILSTNDKPIIIRFVE